MRPLAGPSELARYGLLHDVPNGYWRRYAAEVTARLRAKRSRCSCATVGQLAPDGRCSRCWGWPEGSA